MRTIIKGTYWKILNEFYNENKPIHLRELSRRIKLKEGALSRHLNKLKKENILLSKKEGNLKKFMLNFEKKAEIFTIIDINKYENLPYLRKKTLNFYIEHLKEKPIFVILFGSTAKGTLKKNSDIDIITVFNKKTNTKESQKNAEAQTGIKIREFQLTFNEFIKEIKLKKDYVIQAGLETGFPIYNHLYYYKIIDLY